MSPANAAPRRIPMFLALFLTGSAAGMSPEPAVAGPWQGKEVVEAGVPVVRNPATPMEKPLTLSLEELWRIGGESEEEGEFFGLITDVDVHPTGDVYLLDMQLSEVKVFDTGGAYLRTIGREGEGPGEFRRPGSLFFDPEGNVGVVQTMPSRVVMLHPDGTPAEPMALPNPDDGGFRMLRQGMFRGGSLVVQGGNFRRVDNSIQRTSALVRLDRQGREVARFHEDTQSSNMAKLVIREGEMQLPWTVGPQGNVYGSLDQTWKLHVWKPSGEVERIIQLDYKPVMRSAAEIEKVKKDLGARIMIRGRGGRIEPEFEVSNQERDIRWFAVADDGHLWVLSSRGLREQPQGAIGTFDLFDAAGRYLQQVTLRGDGDFEEDRFVLSGDHLFVIKQFEAAARAMSGAESEEADEAEELAEPMSVICYRLAWTPGRAVASPGSQ